MSDEEREQGQEAGLRKIEPEELNRILAEHEKWVELGGKGGKKANLRGAIIEEGFFGEASLENAVFREANLRGAYFESAKLIKAIFYRSNLTGADLSKSDLTNAQFMEANLNNVSMLGAKIESTNFNLADLRGADLTYAEGGGVNLKRAKLQQATMTHIKLPGANMHEAQLQGAVLLNADLDGAFLLGANLSNAILDEAAFPHTELSNSTAIGARFYKSNLTKASLSSANLSNACLMQAKLINANLQGANLTNADLRYADLTDAVLLDATPLAGMDLTGTRLPTDIARWEGLAHVAEGARRAAKLFTTLLLGCFYCALVTLGGWFVDEDWLAIPLGKDLDIFLEDFYLAAPALLLALFFYFQIYMQRLWEPLALLPAIFPDGTPLDKKATPWLPLGYVRAHVAKLRQQDKSLLTRLQNLAIAGLLWGLAPATLAAFWWGYFSFPDKTPLGLAWQAGLTLAALAVAFYFQALCRQTLRREAAEKASLVDLAWFLLGVVPYFAAITYFRWPG